jgi:N-acetylneuraminic acid mutarotase
LNRRGAGPSLLLAGLLLIGLLLAACEPATPVLPAESLPPLPEPVANNAVARAGMPGAGTLVSLMGLGPGREWRDVHARSFALPPGAIAWERMPDVPGPGGRLAGSAVGLADAVILFGGYTVAADGDEVSVERVQRLDLATRAWRDLAPMPVPVDDAVAVLHRDRYVYLVSGWHDSGNVNLVQVYDVAQDRWFQATPWPGPAVFGHAGGIVGDVLVICDGVGIETRADAPRRFVAIAACYRGEIDGTDPARIDWRRLPWHGGRPLYRMAAAGSEARGQVVFAGGSENPYNYDGIGYDGEPSAPSGRVFAFDLAAGEWRELGRLPEPTMDHRGLLETAGGFVLVGGMRAGQAIADTVVRIRLPEPVPSAED